MPSNCLEDRVHRVTVNSVQNTSFKITHMSEQENNSHLTEGLHNEFRPECQENAEYT